MRKVMLIVFLIFTSVLITACGENNASNKEIINTISQFKFYDDIESLTTSADLIIKGTVTESTPKWLNTAMEPDDSDDEKVNPGGEIEPNTDIWTVHTVKIDYIYKGEAGKTIEIKQFGGELDNTIMTDEHVTFLEKGEEYILFLETYEDSPASLLNPIQSYYKLEEGNIIKHPENSFTVDLEALEKLEK
ncbi:hypothetical protein GGQ92_001601 [Gracilibacillus halotolerans]|uniref:Lipoprotein n=1 Tax=Gracilibacillus halotolerans TaxID=74386 RepID=A0A841RLJ6_9BACI|nr:hypothetical protein [Gracilibacillus halotolerans]MBB6512812.1 hypothetical protein [Gracilibacillus halotolerans]